MKKFLAVLVIAGTLVACNNEASTAESKTDSLDAVASEKKEMIDSTAEAKKEMIDSTTEAKKDALQTVDSLNRKESSATKH